MALDATSSLGVRTGVANVTAGLLDHLATRDDVDVTAFALTWRGRHRLAGTLPPSVRAATRPFPARLTRVLWPRVRWPTVEHWTGPVDVVHANHVAPPTSVPVLLTIHDMTFVRFPELCSRDALHYPRLVDVALERGAFVHTHSHFVADEVREHYGLAAERVIPIAPGLDPHSPGDARRGQQLAASERYVLAVGTVEPRKNFPTLVRAFDAIAAADREVVLVIAGQDGWGAEEFSAAVARSPHRDRIRRPGFLDNASRDDLVAGASVLAYPSVYEGFGLPPLEAMQAGIPVVASNAGSLPEVLGDAAVLTDPADVDALAAALEEVLQDDSRRRCLIDRGHRRVHRYGWDQTVERFVATYRSLAAT